MNDQVTLALRKTERRANGRDDRRPRNRGKQRRDKIRLLPLLFTGHLRIVCSKHDPRKVRFNRIQRARMGNRSSGSLRFGLNKVALVGSAN